MSETYPQDLAPPILSRNYYGWFSLSVLFLLLIGLGFAASSKKTELGSDTTTLETKLKGAVSSEAVADSTLFKTNKSSLSSRSDKEFNSILKIVEPRRFSDPVSAEFYCLVRSEMHQTVQKPDVSILESGTVAQKKVAQILANNSLTPEVAAALTAGIPENNFFRRLLRADAFAKAGDPLPRQQLLSELRASEFITYGLVSALCFFSMIMWMVYLGLKGTGGLKPLGLPNLPTTLFGADQLASKSVLFFGAYMVLEIIVELLGRKSIYFSVAGSLATVAAFPLLFRIKSGGGPLSFESLGIGRNSPWMKLVGLGCAGFLMEFPLAFLMGALGTRLFQHETFTHPAAAQLVNSHNFWTVLSLFLLASVQAPIFEEMIFRGLMLPAITRVVGLIPSIAITSCLFAFLHPQGVGAWLGLATIAACSSVLIYHTKSILPSIILHALHNGLTLVLVLLLS